MHAHNSGKRAILLGPDRHAGVSVVESLVSGVGFFHKRCIWLIRSFPWSKSQGPTSRSFVVQLDPAL